MKLIKYYYNTNKKTVITLIVLALLFILSIAIDKTLQYHIYDIYNVAPSNVIKVFKITESFFWGLSFVLVVIISLLLIANIIGNIRGLKRKFLIKNYGKIPYIIYIFVMTLVYGVLINLLIYSFGYILFIKSIMGALIRYKYPIPDMTYLYMQSLFPKTAYNIVISIVVMLFCVMFTINIKESFSSSKYKYKSLKIRMLHSLQIIFRYILIVALLTVGFIAFSFVSPIYNNVSVFINTDYTTSISTLCVLAILFFIVVVLDFIRKFLAEIFV